MKKVNTFEPLTGYGHIGFRVNLNVSDEYAIAHTISNLKIIQYRLKEAEKDYAQQNQQLTTVLQDAQYLISKVNTFLRKMTTITDLSESDLFEEPVLNETEKGE